jgi:hypothetical protein
VDHTNLTCRDVETPCFKRLAESGGVLSAEADGIALPQVQLSQSPFEHRGWLTLMAGVKGLNNIAVTVDPYRLERYGADVDSYSSRMLHVHTLS